MDPIADMINRIRVGVRSRKDMVEIPSSKIKREIARLLKEEGYIANFRVFDNKKSGSLKILLRYTNDGEPAISNIERLSKPSVRRYAACDEIKANPGFGVTILSTPKGITTDRQARQWHVGGELLLRVW